MLDHAVVRGLGLCGRFMLVVATVSVLGHPGLYPVKWMQRSTSHAQEMVLVSLCCCPNPKTIGLRRKSASDLVMPAVVRR